MKWLSVLLPAFLFVQARGQENCPHTSPLFKFSKNTEPENFEGGLGKHPQFAFLQGDSGVNTVQTFLSAVKNREKQLKYPNQFKRFSALLKDIGFRNGYHDLDSLHIRKVFVPYGTVGNLGYYDKDTRIENYIFIELNPRGEDPQGVEGWMITGPTNCYIYLLQKCGNAFYPIDTCCRNIDIQAATDTLVVKPATRHQVIHIQISQYQADTCEKEIITQAQQQRKQTKMRRNRVPKLLKLKDTLIDLQTFTGQSIKVYGKELEEKLTICRDTIVKIYQHLLADSIPGSTTSTNDTLNFSFSDTSYLPCDCCHPKWEIALSGGISYNSIPRINDPAQHTQNDKGWFAGELAVSRRMRNWLNLGLSVSLLNLSWQDDLSYPGSTAGTYNRVIVGKPVIPIQVFGKFSVCKNIPGLVMSLSVSAGIAIPSDGQIENSNGTTLSTPLQSKTGFTAGLKWSADYFITSRFGIGISAAGQACWNKVTNSRYHDTYCVTALPLLLGVRYRL